MLHCVVWLGVAPASCPACGAHRDAALRRRHALNWEYRILTASAGRRDRRYAADSRGVHRGEGDASVVDLVEARNTLLACERTKNGRTPRLADRFPPRPTPNVPKNTASQNKYSTMSGFTRLFGKPKPKKPAAPKPTLGEAGERTARMILKRTF